MQLQSLVVDLLAKNKVLSCPAAIQSLPLSAGQEDFNSMGLTSAVKTRDILENARTILAIEFFAAAQGLDFRNPEKAGYGVFEAYKTIRKIIPFLDQDRVLYEDIKSITELVKNGEILKNVSKIIRLD